MSLLSIYTAALSGALVRFMTSFRDSHHVRGIPQERKHGHEGNHWRKLQKIFERLVVCGEISRLVGGSTVCAIVDHGYVAAN